MVSQQITGSTYACTHCARVPGIMRTYACIAGNLCGVENRGRKARVLGPATSYRQYRTPTVVLILYEIQERESGSKGSDFRFLYFIQDEYVSRRPVLPVTCCGVENRGRKARVLGPATSYRQYTRRCALYPCVGMIPYVRVYCRVLEVALGIQVCGLGFLAWPLVHGSTRVRIAPVYRV